MPTRREFHACAPDAVAAFVDHFDETVALYHHREGDAFSEGGGDPDDRDEHERADPPGDAVDEASWFTTPARQMAATIHGARTWRAPCRAPEARTNTRTDTHSS